MTMSGKIERTGLPSYLLNRIAERHGLEAVNGKDEQEKVEQALYQTKGDKSAAAKLLGWSRMRIYRALKRSGLPLDCGKRRGTG